MSKIDIPWQYEQKWIFADSRIHSEVVKYHHSNSFLWSVIRLEVWTPTKRFAEEILGAGSSNTLEDAQQEVWKCINSLSKEEDE